MRKVTGTLGTIQEAEGIRETILPHGDTLYIHPGVGIETLAPLLEVEELDECEEIFTKTRERLRKMETEKFVEIDLETLRKWVIFRIRERRKAEAREEAEGWRDAHNLMECLDAVGDRFPGEDVLQAIAKMYGEGRGVSAIWFLGFEAGRKAMEEAK